MVTKKKRTYQRISSELPLRWNQEATKLGKNFWILSYYLFNEYTEQVHCPGSRWGTGSCANKASKPAGPDALSSTTKEQQVAVVGHSPLRMEAPICQHYLLSTEGCRFPRAWTWDIVVRLPRLVQPCDYHLLLLFHVDTSDMASADLEHTTGDCMSPGAW